MELIVLKNKLLTLFVVFLVFCLLGACSFNRQSNLIHKKLSESINKSNDELFIKQGLQEIRSIINRNAKFAKSLLDELNYDTLTTNCKIEYILNAALIDVKEHKYISALNWLKKPELKQTNDIEYIKQTHLLKAISYTKIYQYNNAFKEWLAVESSIEEATYQQHMDLLWQTFLNVPINYLQQQQYKSAIITSLLELALILRSSTNTEAIAIQVNDWQAKWDTCPTKKYCNSKYKTLLTNKYTKVTILLPLSGPLEIAGRDIQEGIITAYFNHNKKNDIKLNFYDTNSENINELIKKAKDNDTDFFIGPLTKENIESLSADSLSNTSFLTLNYFANNDLVNLINNENKDTVVYQFGLTTDDEIKSITNYAKSLGYEKAIIMVPKNNHGRKIGEEYKKYWQDLGGVIVDYVEFNKKVDFTKFIGSVMGIDASNKRINDIKDILQTDLESKPSIRSDVEVLFLMASPEEARQIKPALLYQFSRDIPVFATSHIYSKIPSVTTDSDLNGVYIPALRWQEKDVVSTLKNKVVKFPRLKNQNKNLFALGIDSYNLFTDIHRLRLFRDSSLKGLTGNLTIDSEFKIKRQLNILRFKSGRLVTSP